MARKKENDYFQMFMDGVAFSVKAAQLLEKSFKSYDPSQLPQRMEEMHQVEHSADMAKHEMMGRLAKEFLPPIEREDIMVLANRIDDVTDAIEDVLRRLYMFNIGELRQDVGEFTTVISKCCSSLGNIMEEFRNFRKSALLREKIIELNGLEEEGDRLYTEAMRRLYTEGGSPIAVMAWTILYDTLEKCCDCCESVADAVDQVVMKNS